jgi:hypothetical protein
MYFEIRELVEDIQQLEAAAAQYEEHGLFVLT